MLRILVAVSLAVSLAASVSALIPERAMPAIDCGTASPSLSASPLAGADSTLLALYARGEAYPEFLENTRRRREGWHSINDSVRIADSSLVRARMAASKFKLLVVAIDACGDSMQQVPYVARLAELVPGLALRIVPPAVGATAQQSHRSLDGRTATPTFILLDEQGQDVGCIVEYPRELRRWTHAQRDTMKSGPLHDYAAAWYKADRGASIVHEVVELMEQARAGTPVCERGEAKPAGAL